MNFIKKLFGIKEKAIEQPVQQMEDKDIDEVKTLTSKQIKKLLHSKKITEEQAQKLKSTPINDTDSLIALGIELVVAVVIIDAVYNDGTILDNEPNCSESNLGSFDGFQGGESGGGGVGGSFEVDANQNNSGSDSFSSSDSGGSSSFDSSSCDCGGGSCDCGGGDF